MNILIYNINIEAFPEWLPNRLLIARAFVHNWFESYNCTFYIRGKLLIIRCDAQLLLNLVKILMDRIIVKILMNVWIMENMENIIVGKI